MRSALPLSDLVVLDFTRAVAGPFCTMNLGDLGARVIKVEEQGSGDETRNYGPPFVDGVSPYFLSVNRNKESLAVDLKSAAGLERVRSLARTADISIENFRAGVADRLGIGYEDLRRENPQIIYVSICGFGHDGPERDRPGYDLIAQGMSGVMDISRPTGGPPVKIGFPLADVFTAMYASQAILAALHRREREACGAYIELSLLECMMAAMAPLTSAYLTTGREPQPSGRAQANIVPYQIFECQDGAVTVGVPNERLWRRFATALRHPEWIDDPRFVDNAARVRNRADLQPIMEAVMQTRPAAEWIRILGEFEVPCGPVNTVGQALDSDLIRARNAIATMEHSKLGTLRTFANPTRIRGVEFAYKGPPELGENEL